MEPRRGIRVWVDIPDPEPRKLHTAADGEKMSTWKCMQCQNKVVDLQGRFCPTCKRPTSWTMVSNPDGTDTSEIAEATVNARVEDILGADTADAKTETDAEKRGKYELEQVLAVTGSSRPCLVSTCGGLQYAYLHTYRDGKHRLIFTCQRCHIDYLPGETTAVTKEPTTSMELLA